MQAVLDELFTSRSAARLERFFEPEHQLHAALSVGPIIGLEALRRRLEGVWRAFNCTSFQLESVVNDGDLLYARAKLQLRHSGAIEPWVSAARVRVSTTGRWLMASAQIVTAWRDGRIRETHVEHDAFDALVSFGALEIVGLAESQLLDTADEEEGSAS